jgi:hypothetical protein
MDCVIMFQHYIPCHRRKGQRKRAMTMEANTQMADTQKSRQEPKGQLSIIMQNITQRKSGYVA